MSLTTDRSDTYWLGRSDAEARRLILQHQIYSPITRQFLSGAGITRGMKVLDVGSGAGDVALLCADLVGPQGRVIGVEGSNATADFARARVRASGWANVEFLEGDIRDLDLPDDFDAVVGRWVLMYVEEPAALLRRLVQRLRPGGIVAFQESANLKAAAQTYPPTPLHEDLRRWLNPPVDPPMPVFDMGLRLYRTFLEAGLDAPELRQDAPIGGGPHWPGYGLVAESLRSLLPFVEQLGTVTADEVDIDTFETRLRAEALQHDAVQILPVVVGAWAPRR
ncbi:MAG: class I SAM-dependent methyltransferase [Acidimicrobiia bacterium]